MAKAKKPSGTTVMDALAKKMKAIGTGEFAPLNSSSPRARKPMKIDAALKQAIRKSGRTYYDLGRAAGVAPSVILRFMSDDPQARGGDLRLSTAAKIACELGLALN